MWEEVVPGAPTAEELNSAELTESVEFTGSTATDTASRREK
ncbi:hypothetical protein [Trueperella sp. LYQ141]